jgi:hypothetical protein
MTKAIIEIYQGVVIDRLGSLPTKRTRWYENYRQARFAAERLCLKSYKDRGKIDILFKNKTVNVV